MTAIIEIYTEYTPNPESLKFVLNHMLLRGSSLDFRNKEETSNSPLATALFDYEYVNGVFIANNFVTITKNPESQWEEIIPELKGFLKKYISEEGKVVINPEETKTDKSSDSGNPSDIENRIVELLDTYVKPAVEMDGGAIQFKSFEDGKVTVFLQGSCSGCPSATVTLKAGIEAMLQRMIPEVEEVVAEEI